MSAAPARGCSRSRHADAAATSHRLGILLPPLGNQAAGLAVYVQELVPRLLAARPDSVVFAQLAGPPPSWCRGARVVDLAGGALRRVAGSPAGRRLARLVATQLRLRRALGRHPVDTLLVPFHDGVVRSPVPQAVIVHDLTLLRYRLPGSRLAGLHLRTIFRPIARSARVVIAVSESTRRDLALLWGIDRERVRVVPEGYDRSLFRAFSDDEVRAVLHRYGVTGPYVFYAGTFLPHKNLATAVDALARIGDRRPELRFLVCGPEDAAAVGAFLASVRRADLEDRVRVLGYLPRQDLGPLMAGAAAFVFPSLQEGFGLSVLEAMASGAAVLASNRASLPEVVGDGGQLLDPRRPALWADAILGLLERPTISRRWRRAALARAATFDWDLTARGVLDAVLEPDGHP